MQHIFSVFDATNLLHSLSLNRLYASIDHVIWTCSPWHLHCKCWRLHHELISMILSTFAWNLVFHYNLYFSRGKSLPKLLTIDVCIKYWTCRSFRWGHKHAGCCYIRYPSEKYLNTLRPSQMDAIWQTTFSSAFSWIKMFEFLLTFHWSLFLRVESTIFQH